MTPSVTAAAAVLHGPRSLAIEQGRVRAPAADEVRVRVTAAGLCGTDYRIWTGERPVAYPRIMGHEFVGRVAAIGERVNSLTVDERVVVEPNYSCGHCPLCREGNRNLCLSRTAIGIDVDGGFAEEACVPERCCWKIPAGVSDLEAMVTEPLAVDLVVETAGTPEAVAHALDLVRPGGRVVLTGLPHEPTPVAFFSVVRREVTITGSMIYQDEFPAALELVAAGKVKTSALVTHRFALADIDAAFAARRDSSSIKVALAVG